MKYAGEVSEIINAFSPEPLKRDEMEQFYCGDTMEYRMSDKYSSPMEDILDACQMKEAEHIFLLLGHRGCGKSTELNRMSEELAAKGYPVKTIACSMDLDLFNLIYSDLFILMGEALLKIAEESGCKLGKKLLSDIGSFWDEGIRTMVVREQGAVSLETGISAGASGLLSNLLGLFAKIRAELKFNEETREEYRKRISTHSSEWVSLLSRVAEEIDKAAGKLPVIIFEDLDKLNPEDAWRIFYNYAAVLSGMPFPVIYTFPIGLSYDTRFSAIESYFTAKTLPMIRIENLDGTPYREGIAVIREIVKMRADLALFEPDALEKMIQYTGGSLRDLFHVINAAAKRAVRRKSSAVSMDDAERALEELKTSLTRRIEKRDYDFLRNIYWGNKELIEDKVALLKMLQASVVLEYNGKRWHNVHPLIAQFLAEQGLMEHGRA